MHLEIGFDRQNRFLNVSREKMEGMERLGIVRENMNGIFISLEILQKRE